MGAHSNAVHQVSYGCTCERASQLGHNKSGVVLRSASSREASGVKDKQHMYSIFSNREVGI